MSFAIGLAIGLAFGWVVPRPQWFIDLLTKLKDKINKENP